MNKFSLDYIVTTILTKKSSSKLSLFTGLSGETLILFEIYKLNKKNNIKNICYENIDKIYSNIKTCNSLNFCDGLAGILFMFAYLENNKFIITEKDFYDSFDEYFDNHLIFLSDTNNYDLLYGIIGIGIYYLELIKIHPHKITFLHKIINYIFFISRKYNDIIYWKYTLESNSALKNKDIINLGMLHGIPSIIAFFLTCIKRGYTTNIIKKEIYKIIHQISIYSLPESKQHTFPNFVYIDNNQIIRDNNIPILGYCYGDLSIINLLYLSYKIYNDNTFKLYAENIFEKISYRIYFDNKIDEPFFCHGYASLYYFINKFSKTLNLTKKDKENISNLNIIIRDKLLTNINYDNMDILNGSGGIFLVLLLEYKSNFIEKILMLDII